MSLHSKQEKLERYQFIIKRLNEAIKQGFDIQAIAYEYALIEDRFNSFLIYFNITLKTNKVKDKIKAIRNLQHINLTTVLPSTLFDELFTWIDHRNKIMHGMAMMTLEPSYITSIAKQGLKIVKLLNKITYKMKLIGKMVLN
jgi:hypothetical protein